jgi:hypothetical protein
LKAKKMKRYLIYIQGDLPAIGNKLSELVDLGEVDEFFTLTENGQPIVFEPGMVGDPDFCNGLALRCAGITEE